MTSPPSRAHSTALGGEEAVTVEASEAPAAWAGMGAGLPLPPPPPRTAPLLRALRLGAASTYYTMADALGLRKLGDLIKGAGTLPPSTAPLHLLGVCYFEGGGSGDAPGAPTTPPPPLPPDALAALAADLASLPRFTYRRGLTCPIPASPQDAAAGAAAGLTSDVGWGCTLRSGQALLAQALVRAAPGLGRAWRRDGGGEGEGATPSRPPRLPPDAAAILRAFADSPSAPLSLHALIAAGGPSSPGPGEWWGPWALCHAAAVALEKGRVERAFLPACPHLRTLLVAGPGGGAPSLSLGDAGWGEGGEGGKGEAPPAGAGGEGEVQEGAPPPPSSFHDLPVLVLIPLVLGSGRALNPVYLPALASTLSFPQSVGILGGRKGAALWVVGAQGTATALVVDPHTPQAAVDDPEGEVEAGTGEEGGDEEGVVVEAAAPGEAAPAAPAPCPAASYFHAPLRTAPLVGLDPSLALGFLARDRAEWADLVARLAALEAACPGAPLVCMRKDGEGGGGRGEVELGRSGREGEEEDEEGGQEDGGWVLV